MPYLNDFMEYICDQIEAEGLSTDDLRNFLADLPGELENRNEARAEAAYEALQASGGPDDSAYSAAMKDAGRGHLLK
jgi:hypothetical protein